MELATIEDMVWEEERITLLEQLVSVGETASYYGGKAALGAGLFWLNKLVAAFPQLEQPFMAPWIEEERKIAARMPEVPQPVEIRTNLELQQVLDGIDQQLGISRWEQTAEHWLQQTQPWNEVKRFVKSQYGLVLEDVNVLAQDNEGMRRHVLLGRDDSGNARLMYLVNGELSYDAIESQVGISLLDYELVVRKKMLKRGWRIMAVDEISALTNRFEGFQDGVLDRGSALFRSMVEAGGSSNGEQLQVVTRLMHQGIGLKPDGSLVLHKGLLAHAERIVGLALNGVGNVWPIDWKERSRHIIYEAAEKRVLYSLTQEWLNQCGELLDLVSPKALGEMAREWRKVYPAFLGQTDLSCLFSMLGHMMVREVGKERGWSEHNDILLTLLNYYEIDLHSLLEHSGLAGIANHSQPLASLIALLPARKREAIIDEEVAYEVLKGAYTCYDRLVGEMRRKPANKAMIRALRWLSRNWIDGDERLGLWETLVGSVMLHIARGDDGKPFVTAQSWLDAKGYFGKTKKVPWRVVQRPTTRRIGDLLEEWKQAKSATEQIDFMDANIDWTMSMLSGQRKVGYAIPKEVADLFAAFQDKEVFAKNLLSVANSIWDNDPLTLGPFFKNMDEIWETTRRRFAYDFWYALDLQLKNYGGSLTEAMSTVLEDGRHRIAYLNHQEGPKVLKDKQETYLEASMRGAKGVAYYEWKPMWNVWNIIGAYWDCACWARVVIFNVHTLQQY